VTQVELQILQDGKYDTEFPNQNCSKELEAISKTVKKVYSTVTYDSYSFATDLRITKDKVSAALLKQTESTSQYRNTVLGTGTVIYYRDWKIAVLTCAHLFNKPDTVYTYYDNEDLSRGDYLQNIAIKQKQVNMIPEMPGDGRFEILLMDENNDIALLGKTLRTSPSTPINVFDHPFGSAKELDWGAFVYLFGYPRGFKMVTKGIVSSPNKNDAGEFIIDALFNRGLSGGLILAIRDGVPNFELVGIATSSAAEDDAVLVPLRDFTYDEHSPYVGRIYVENKKRIDYGITLAISTEAISKLIQANTNLLNNKGYYMDFSITK
jgi:hypothetical protein